MITWQYSYTIIKRVELSRQREPSIQYSVQQRLHQLVRHLRETGQPLELSKYRSTQNQIGIGLEPAAQGVNMPQGKGCCEKSAVSIINDRAPRVYVIFIMAQRKRYSEELRGAWPHTQWNFSQLKRHSALNTQQLDTFFKKKLQTPSIHMAISMTQNIESKVQDQLSSGDILIPNATSTTEEDSRNLVQLNEKKNKLQRELQLLKHVIKSQKFKPLRSMNSSKLTEEQHQKLVKKIRRQKKQVDEKRQKYIQQLQRKREQDSQREKEKTKLGQERSKGEKRMKISLSMKSRQEQKLRRYNSSLEKPRPNSKLLYRQLENKYIKEVVLPAIQEKNQKLKEINEMKRPIRIEEIRKHESQYLKRRAELSQSSLKKQKEQSKTYQPSYKSSRLEKLRKQMQQERKAKEEQRRLSLQAKMQRLESFKKYLAENFKPHVSEEKRKQMEQKIIKQTSKARSTSSNAHEMGNQYLEYSKAKTKKQDTVDNPEGRFSVTEIDKPRSRSKPNYIRTNVRAEPTVEAKINNLLKSNSLTPQDKMYELRMQTEKLNTLINEKQKLGKVEELKHRSDSSELLLASIKARMGMLEIYNN